MSAIIDGDGKKPIYTVDDIDKSYLEHCFSTTGEKKSTHLNRPVERFASSLMRELSLNMGRTALMNLLRDKLFKNDQSSSDLNQKIRKLFNEHLIADSTPLMTALHQMREGDLDQVKFEEGLQAGEKIFSKAFIVFAREGDLGKGSFSKIEDGKKNKIKEYDKIRENKDVTNGMIREFVYDAKNAGAAVILAGFTLFEQLGNIVTIATSSLALCFGTLTMIHRGFQIGFGIIANACKDVIEFIKTRKQEICNRINYQTWKTDEAIKPHLERLDRARASGLALGTPGGVPFEYRYEGPDRGRGDDRRTDRRDDLGGRRPVRRGDRDGRRADRRADRRDDLGGRRPARRDDRADSLEGSSSELFTRSMSDTGRRIGFARGGGRGR
jgi:hypothetical protein